MAFILKNKDQLARDVWPDGIGQLVQERSLTVATLPAARKVPEDAEELAEWLWVDRQEPLSQARVYIHQDVEGIRGGTEPQELALRFQGIIGHVSVGVGGDWDGTEVNAKKANQHLTLCNGGCPDAFDPQIRVLKAVREAIFAQLGSSEDGQRRRQDGIVFRRRVFTKIRQGINDALPSLIRDGDDPRGRFKAIAHSWRVTEKLRAGAQLAHGEIFPVNPLSLRKGDFVDVSARLVVVFSRGPHGRRHELCLEPIVIVRLTGAAQVQETRRQGASGLQTSTMEVGFKMVEIREEGEAPMEE
ncbi:hypothetical protein BN946_scf185001.g2 [Trametes cinnabarina]|uniref:Uncharacterized protein n=1 Tax=Pycnoporus cinnabarinus TaxID=5643 RepID=A0A060SRC0_PYCCI|nr:hypothetical protein BN946_scf185001.g2 [Trametes cinnabarina]